MITDITVENYRLFEKLHVEGMTRVTLLVGQNNSGKSSLLEAIYLLASGERPSHALFDILEQRGAYVVDNNYGVNYQMAHVFKGRQLKEGYPVKISTTSPYQNISLYFASSDPKERRIRPPTLEPDVVITIYLDDEPRAFLGLDSRHQTIAARRAKAAEAAEANLKNWFVTPFSFNPSELGMLWDNIHLTSKEDVIDESMRILEPDFQRLGFTSQRSTQSDIILKLKGQDTPVPLSSMGGGMRQILTLAIALANCEGGTLLVDDIDTGLHHTALTKMWKVVIETAKKLDVQVFATTHNWDCVASLDEALTELGDDESGSMFRLDKQDNLTWVVPYDRQRLGIAVEQDVEVR